VITMTAQRLRTYAEAVADVIDAATAYCPWPSPVWPRGRRLGVLIALGRASRSATIRQRSSRCTSHKWPGTVAVLRVDPAATTDGELARSPMAWSRSRSGSPRWSPARAEVSLW
jgi:hypothetical protein